MQKNITKITIVGAGFVGSTTAYTLMLSGLASEIVLIDINKNKVDAEVMDMNHGMQFTKPSKIYAGNYSDSKNSDIVIITAGASQKKGETRIALVERNIPIFKYIVNEVVKYNEDSILLVVTNPVDILTYITYKISGYPKNKVLGSGTVLDTARFRYLIGNNLDIDSRNIHAYIIGEHGDTEVPTWSNTNIAGINIDEYCKTCDKCVDGFSKEHIFNSVKNSAYEIISKKGATYYAVALAVIRIVETIVRDENSILTVSSVLEGEYNIKDTAISVPTIVSKIGIKRVLEIKLRDNEQKSLEISANSLKQILEKIKL